MLWGKIEESEKAGSCRESNPGYLWPLAWAMLCHWALTARGVLGSTPSDCRAFHFPLFSPHDIYISLFLAWGKMLWAFKIFFLLVLISCDWVLDLSIMSCYKLSLEEIQTGLAVFMWQEISKSTCSVAHLWTLSNVLLLRATETHCHVVIIPLMEVIWEKSLWP